MTPEQFNAKLRSLVTTRHRRPAGALFTYILVRDEHGAARIACCRCEFADAVRPTRDSIDYFLVRFAETWVNLDDALEILVSMIRGNPVFDGPTAGTIGGVGEPLRRTHDTYSGWPEDVFEARWDSPFPQIPYGTIVRRGLPPIESGSRASVEWLWGSSLAQQWQGGHIPHQHEIVVVVPDTRARFVGAKWSESNLIVDVESNMSARSVELQGLMRNASGWSPIDTRTDLQGPVAWPTSREVFAAKLFLVAEDSSLLHEIDVQRGFDEATVGQPTVEQQAEIDLRHTETDTVEFKSWIRPGDRKEEELVRVAIAFANTKGGRLYIGVQSDTREPEGYKQLKAILDDVPTDRVKYIADHTASVLAEGCKPSVPFRVNHTRARGEPIVVVFIDEGHEKPYATHGNDVFIREGGRTRKADPRTEIPQLASAGNPAWPA